MAGFFKDLTIDVHLYFYQQRGRAFIKLAEDGIGLVYRGLVVAFVKVERTQLLALAGRLRFEDHCLFKA